MSEISEGIRTKNDKLANIGFARLKGASGYKWSEVGNRGYFGVAAGTGSMGLLGLQRPPKRKKEKSNLILSLIGAMGQELRLILYGVEDGKFSYIDLSASDPWWGVGSC